MKRILLVALFLHASLAYAQQAGDLGIIVRYDGGSSIGVIYHLLDHLALRPVLSLSGSGSRQTENDTEMKSNTWGFGIGLNALYYLTRDSSLSTYGGAGVLTDLRFTNGTRSGPWGNDEQSLSYGPQWGFTGFAGAQVPITGRLAVFGEVGLAVRIETVSSEERSSTHWFLTTFASSLGATFYL